MESNQKKVISIKFNFLSNKLNSTKNSLNILITHSEKKVLPEIEKKKTSALNQMKFFVNFVRTNPIYKVIHFAFGPP